MNDARFDRCSACRDLAAPCSACLAAAYAPVCSCASPRVGWCDLHRVWTPTLPADPSARRRALAHAEACLYLDDPRLRPHATEPR